MQRARPRPRIASLAGALFFAACVSARGGALEPRFVAVHNALAAMGLAQIGPIQQGSLVEGQAARVPLQLPAGCVTVAAIAGDGVRDVDATLLDARGTPLAHDTTTEPQAVLRPCLDAADAYVLVVKATAGSGTWVAAAWAGGASSEAATPLVAAEANGTCEAPIRVTAGTTSGSTSRGEHENAGSCSPSDSRELVYELDVTRRQRVSIEVEADFDSVLYIRKDDCADAGAEVDCNDDAPDRMHSRIERVLDAGKYFVFVDGYNQEAGAFKLTIGMSDVLALADMCQKAPVLAAGAPQGATTVGSADDAEATCGGGAQGSDGAWRAEVATRSRVRIVEHSDEMVPVVHVRRACTDEQSEVACGEAGAGTGDAAVTGLFEAGTYTVFADSREHESAGHYTLALDTLPPGGAGTAGDACSDAIALGGGSGAAGAVNGDTFPARDDLAGSCGGVGAPDVVYRVDVPRRSRFVASLEGEEATHVLVAWRRCGDRSGELACGRSIDTVLEPGTYFVGVDGLSPDAFGRFTLDWAMRDLTGQSGACGAATLLVEGHVASATTTGAGDKFGTSCGAADAGASGPDRVFKLVLASRATVRVVVTAAGFDAAIALRRACADGSGGPTGAGAAGAAGAAGTAGTAHSGGADVEIACESDADATHRTSIEHTLDAGTYWVVVDGRSPNDQGAFTVEYRLVR